MGVGMPYVILLQEFGEHAYHAFGHMAYHVGSSLREKHGWRDVDVRVIIPDDEYAALGLGDPVHTHHNRKWVSLVLAWSCFGKHLTGLPIDFQLQQRTHANTDAGCAGSRSALIVPSRMAQREAVQAVVDQMTCGNCGTAAYQPNERCGAHGVRGTTP